MSSHGSRQAAWRALADHARKLAAKPLRTLFSEDPNRGERLCAAGAGLHLDYSKNRIDDETLALLLALAEACELPARIEALFRGERLNTSEDQPALHTALRAPRDAGILVDGRDVCADVHAVLDRVCAAAEAIRAGTWKGHTGRRVRHVVNIGIGGSSLGPEMAYEALRFYATSEVDVRFLSNIDGSDFAEATRGLDPAETFFTVCSKTFTTQETLANARTARAWCLDALGEEAAISKHFAAVTAAPERAREFGIDAANCFELWDWVGGRYSFDSAVGLALAIAIGPDRFRELLGGLREMDEHFRATPPARNLPVLLGLIGIWYANFFGAETYAVMPYDRYLRRFPAWLQQLDMESNGKSVTADGAAVDASTGPIVFGEPGTDAQHSYHQLLHQGTHLVPCDFIGFCQPLHAIEDRQDQLIANLLAQAEALAFGRSAREVADAGVPAAQVPHRTFPGNRPSNVLFGERLTPRALGALAALYEHKVFVQASVWGINPFDQWGVELGKELAGLIAAELAGDDAPAHDSSTNALMLRYRRSRRDRGT